MYQGTEHGSLKRGELQTPNPAKMQRSGAGRVEGTVFQAHCITKAN